MSLSICYFDVANGRGKCKEDAIYILYGEGTNLKYAFFVGNSVIRGANVIAVAPEDIDVTKEGGKARIVYATHAVCEKFGGWIQGKTLDEVWPDEVWPDDAAASEKNVNCVNIEGEDYVRIDKNCVKADFVGDLPEIPAEDLI